VPDVVTGMGSCTAGTQSRCQHQAKPWHRGAPPTVLRPRPLLSIVWWNCDLHPTEIRLSVISHGAQLPSRELFGQSAQPATSRPAFFAQPPRTNARGRLSCLLRRPRWLPGDIPRARDFVGQTVLRGLRRPSYSPAPFPPGTPAP
jgi:hypothetical protein